MALDELETNMEYLKREARKEQFFLKRNPGHNWMRDEASKRIKVLNAAISAMEQQKLKGDIMEDAVIPTLRNRLYVCEKCRQGLGKSYKFCPSCGRVIKWEE